MATFVSDTFTDANGTTLQLHTGETGATWTKLAGSDSVIQSNRLDPPAAESVYSASGTPAGVEYDVTADLVTLNPVGTGDSAVLGRLVDNSNYYLAQHSSAGGAWRIFKKVTGSFTQLGTFSQSLSASTTYALKLEIRDATKKLYVDGVERVSTTDNALTAAGVAGIRCAATNYHLDNFQAVDAGGGGASIVPLVMNHRRQMAGV